MNTAKTVRVTLTEVGAVLHNTDNGATYSTNPVGARIWIHLTNGVTQDELIDQISTEFVVTKAQVCRDVAEFVEQLISSGFLQEEVSKV
jgi:hypothetical protein